MKNESEVVFSLMLSSGQLGVNSLYNRRIPNSFVKNLLTTSDELQFRNFLKATIHEKYTQFNYK